MDIKELKESIEGIAIGYDYEAVYAELWNTMADYWNENQNWIGEEQFNDFVSYDFAEELAKQELESGGLVRLYFFMGDVNFASCDLLKFDGYGNLTEADINDLENLKEGLLEDIDEEIEEEEDEDE